MSHPSPQYYPPPADAVDYIRIGLVGDAVVLTEHRPNGTEGMVLHIPLEDYRDEFAINWRAWVTSMYRTSRAPEPGAAYLHLQRP